MKRPSNDALLMAAEWLDVHDVADGAGDNPNDPGNQCHGVADWLRAEVEKIEKATLVKDLAREKGVRVTVIKRMLKAKGLK